MDCEQLTEIPAPHLLGQKDATTPMLLRTPLASTVTKDIFLDRFRKEIVDRFHFSLNSQMRLLEGESVHDAKDRRRIIKGRLMVGFSVCGKALQQDVVTAPQQPPVLQLVVLSSDFSPARFAAHIPLLAHQQGVPLLLLPNSSVEMGRLLGVKSAGVLAFCAATEPTEGGWTETERAIHQGLDSFVHFVRNKV
jgi:ribosomal protein L7Ae-like RNA K-turn-binding protein